MESKIATRTDEHGLEMVGDQGETRGETHRSRDFVRNTHRAETRGRDPRRV